MPERRHFGDVSMHDIKLIRDDPASFKAALARRGDADGKLSASIDEAVALDKQWRASKTAFETHQARRNEASKLIGQAKAKKDEAQAKALMEEVAELKSRIATAEEQERVLRDKLDGVLATIPNIPASDVPQGDESANVELRCFGAKPGMNFAPKQHFDLGEALGQMDFEAAARMSGARFVVLKKGLARLERAIAQFMLDLHTEQFGYTEVSPPYMVRDQAMFGTGQLPKFKADLFNTSRVANLDIWDRGPVPQIDPTSATLAGMEATLKGLLEQLENRDVFWLIPTAEVPLTNLVREQILEERQLPLRFTAYTPCFRAEAGAAGRDTRGMIRMHQFSKVELVSITTPEQSAEEHERMTNCAQEVLKRLNLHHRVIVLSTGDMGFGAKKTYDLEVWLPGQDAFREISSCSNCGDFQARRMNARYRPKDEKQTRFVHTLNGSGLAVGRTLVAILENYQQADGSVIVPDVLKSYMGGVARIEA
jgi:seryl-tRNA synthetase